VTQHQPAPGFTVLLVCTGNICRSALAERLGRAFLDEVMGERAQAIRLVSAGTHAVVDSEMHPDSALVLRGFGAEPGDFRARQFQDHMPYEAGLVLTMTRGHRRDVLHRSPRALPRTFTLREAADLIVRLGNQAMPGGDFVDRARNLVKGWDGRGGARRAVPALTLCTATVTGWSRSRGQLPTRPAPGGRGYSAG
jgi:protein-tyrosine-phosphatase